MFSSVVAAEAKDTAVRIVATPTGWMAVFLGSIAGLGLAEAVLDKARVKNRFARFTTKALAMTAGVYLATRTKQDFRTVC